MATAKQVANYLFLKQAIRAGDVGEKDLKPSLRELFREDLDHARKKGCKTNPENVRLIASRIKSKKKTAKPTLRQMPPECETANWTDCMACHVTGNCCLECAVCQNKKE